VEQDRLILYTDTQLIVDGVPVYSPAIQQNTLSVSHRTSVVLPVTTPLKAATHTGELVGNYFANRVSN